MMTLLHLSRSAVLNILKPNSRIISNDFSAFNDINDSVFS